LTSLHQRQSRTTKPATPAFQFQQDHFPVLKPKTSQQPHTTWAQTASQPPASSDMHSLSSLISTLKSFLSMFNLQNICQSVRSLFLQLQTTKDPFSKLMLVLDATIACFTNSN
jgi:hypothetical protein